MPGRTFSREFKREIVRRPACGMQRPAQVCREHGLADSMLALWRKEYAEHGEAAFAPKALPTEAQTAEARVAELERFCGQLALENAVPKKPCRAYGRHGRRRMFHRGASHHDRSHPAGLS
jgi:transposase